MTDNPEDQEAAKHKDSEVDSSEAGAISKIEPIAERIEPIGGRIEGIASPIQPLGKHIQSIGTPVRPIGTPIQPPTFTVPDLSVYTAVAKSLADAMDTTSILKNHEKLAKAIQQSQENLISNYMRSFGKQSDDVAQALSNAVSANMQTIDFKSLAKTLNTTRFVATSNPKPKPVDSTPAPVEGAPKPVEVAPEPVESPGKEVATQEEAVEGELIEVEEAAVGVITVEVLKTALVDVMPKSAPGLPLWAQWALGAVAVVGLIFAIVK